MPKLVPAQLSSSAALPCCRLHKVVCGIAQSRATSDTLIERSGFQSPEDHTTPTFNVPRGNCGADVRTVCATETYGTAAGSVARVVRKAYGNSISSTSRSQ